MLGRGFNNALHALVGQHGERSSSVLGTFLATDQSTLGQPVDSLGKSALGMKQLVRQLGHPDPVRVGLGQVDQDFVVVHSQAGLRLERITELSADETGRVQERPPNKVLLLVEPRCVVLHNRKRRTEVDIVQLLSSLVFVPILQYLSIPQHSLHTQESTHMTTATTELTGLTAGTWDIDPAHSEVGFTVRHLGLSKVRGRFNAFSGTVTIADDQTASSVAASIDLSSVDTNNKMRDGHLKSADFLNAEDSPTMTFVSTGVTETALSGDLTIRGITKPVTLDLSYNGVAVDGYEATRAGFNASGQILRSDFGIAFNAPLGIDGMLVSDKVAIELEIQATRQA